MPLGVLLQAEYADGFVLTEDKDDASPYDEGRNIFHAILNGRPCDEHGVMVRWSVIASGQTYSVDWAELSLLDNPRPIYYREMERTWNEATGEDRGPVCTGHFFGYQYNALDGSNVQELTEIAA